MIDNCSKFVRLYHIFTFVINVVTSAQGERDRVDKMINGQGQTHFKKK